MANAKHRRFVAVMLAALATPAAAQTPQTILQSFQGAWTGTGQARAGLDAAWEEASCEIEIEWRGELRSHGSCEGARGRFSAGGALGIEGGTFLVPHFVEVSGASAALVGSAIVATYEIEGMQFRLTVTVDGRGEMEMTTELGTAGGWATVGTMHLTAQ